MDKITIITVCYNSAATIHETIESVLSQNYPNIEYIIYDGLSTDNTADIVRSYGSRITKFTSEKDNGLYDAMNKAIESATGDVVGILNSDDIYASNDVLTSVMTAFRQRKVECIFGDLSYFKTSAPDKIIRRYRSNNFRPSKVRMGLLPPHPTFFVKRAIYQTYGAFDLQFKYAADFDLMTRFLYVHRLSYSYLPLEMVKMRLGGISTGSFRRIVQINKEDLRSCKKNGVKTNFFLFHFKYFSKIFSIRRIFDLIKPDG